MNSKRQLAIELLRNPGVSSDAYPLLFEVCELEQHDDVVEKITTDNGIYRLSEEDADELS